MSTHLITTPAVGTVCLRCHTVILTGTAEGLTAHVDLIPLTQAGEIATLLANRDTYTLIAGELIRRNASRITDPRLAHPILAAHKCGAQYPPEHRTSHTPTTTAASSEGIPF